MQSLYKFAFMMFVFAVGVYYFKMGKANLFLKPWEKMISGEQSKCIC